MYISKKMKIQSITICSSFLFFLLISTGLLGISEGAAAEGVKKNEIVEGELGRKIDRYLTRITPFGFSGALLVAKEGRIILNKGYGMAIRSTQTPNTSETVFSTGSITKQFTAAGIMKLEMQGKLNTDNPLTKFFKDVPEEKRGITLHHLLTHTSGVINYTGMDYVRASRDETARKILDAPLLFKPGKRFEYSNAGYSLLAAIIEKVSGKGYEEFQNENLFKPAAMKFTGYRIPEWDKKVVAHWYVGNKDNGTPLEKPYPYWNLLGNGGILSTTEDMYKWHLALLGEKVLSAEAKKKIFTAFLNDYGYGWDVLKTERGTLIQHDGGSMLGSSAEIRRYIDADVVTILFCNQSFGREALFEPIRDKIETLIFGGDVAIPPSVVSLDREKLHKFEGTYILSSGGYLEAEAERERLIIKAKGQDAVDVLFFSDKVDPDLIENLNQLSVSVFEAALKGDYQPFERVLYNREKRLEPVRQLIDIRIREQKKRTGRIQEVKAIATLPSDFRGGNVLVTHVQLKGEKGSLFFRLYWRHKKNIGVGPSMFIPELSIPFRSTSGTDFAGYHLDVAKNVRISFKIGKGDSVTGMTVHNPGGDVSARKIITQ